MKYLTTVELIHSELQINTTDKFWKMKKYSELTDSRKSFVWNIIWNTLLEFKLKIKCYIFVLSLRISWTICRSEAQLNILLKSVFGACEQKSLNYLHLSAFDSSAIRREKWTHPYDTSVIMIGLSSDGLHLLH